MTESLHKIIKHYVHHYEHDWKCRDTINRICEDIWESCREADKA